MRNIILVLKNKSEISLFSNKKKVYEMFKDEIKLSYGSFCRSLNDSQHFIFQKEGNEIFPDEFIIQEKQLM
jgi:hypothetical protein